MPLPTPQTNESETDFVARCHQELASEYPDTDQRNAICFKQLRGAGHDKLSALVQQKLPPDRFILLRDVPVFCEHETVDQDGKPQKYDRSALETLIKNNNHRIANAGCFSKLTEGHTPDQEDVAKHGAKQPNVLAFVGPQRLGMVHNDKPKFAIFQDEFWLKEHYPDRIKNCGRSIEMPLYPDMNRRYFSSVAALSAEAPALALPMKFSEMAEGGVKVVRYSAYASAANASIPSTDIASDKKKTPSAQYGDDPPADPAADPNAPPADDGTLNEDNLATKVVEKLVDALKSEPPVDPNAQTAQAPEPQQPKPAPDPKADTTGEPPSKKDDTAMTDAEKKAKEDADKQATAKYSERLQAVETKYSEAQQTIGELKAEVAKYQRLDKDVATLKANAEFAERLVIVKKLQADGYELRDEKAKDAAGNEVIVPGDVHLVETTKYMTREQFMSGPIALIYKYGQKQSFEPRVWVPAGAPMPVTGEDGEVADETARMEASKEAATRTAKLREEGKPARYQEQLQAVYSERKLKLA